MKRDKRNSSLFAVLTRSFLAFALTLLLITVGVYWLWLHFSDQWFGLGDVEGLMASRAFAAEEYERVKPSRYLGRGGAFAVLENGSVRYSSSAEFDASLTPGELSCVQAYDYSSYVDCYSLTGGAGSPAYLLVQTTFLDDGGEESAIMQLDGAYRVLSGGFGDGRTQYTGREFAFLTGAWSDSYELARAEFTAPDGTARTLLVRMPAYTVQHYERAMAAANRIWLLLIPLYLLASGCFIFGLRGRIGRPLARLDRAIVRLGQGETASVESGGPAEIRRLAENFNAMAARLDESERERDRLDTARQKLIADISHDIRTPVTVISGYAGAIRDGRVPADELPRYLEAIAGKAESLTALINTFYEYSKTEHPDFRLSCRDTDLGEFLRAYLAEKYGEIDLAGFALDVCIPETPVRCRLDAFQFRRALDNLVSNSLRCNTPGTMIRVSLRTDAHCARLRVADNGSGIPPAIRGRLFEPFTTGDGARSGGGSGLGLAITRRIVEAHQGSIRLLPQPAGEQGTTFEILLPRIKRPPGGILTKS